MTFEYDNKTYHLMFQDEPKCRGYPFLCGDWGVLSHEGSLYFKRLVSNDYPADRLWIKQWFKDYMQHVSEVSIGVTPNTADLVADVLFHYMLTKGNFETSVTPYFAYRSVIGLDAVAVFNTQSMCGSVSIWKEQIERLQDAGKVVPLCEDGVWLIRYIGSNDYAVLKRYKDTVLAIVKGPLKGVFPLLQWGVSGGYYLALYKEVL